MELVKYTWCYNATDACEEVLLQKICVVILQKGKKKPNCLLNLNAEISNDKKKKTQRLFS